MDEDTVKEPLTLAAVQMTSTAVLEENLETARAFIDQASAGGADIIALPENFSLMSETKHQRHDAAERVNDVEAMLSAAARDNSVVIVGGSTPLPAPDGRVTNTCLVFDDHGRRISRASHSGMCYAVDGMGGMVAMQAVCRGAQIADPARLR